MRNTPSKIFLVLVGATLLMSGCATPHAQLRKNSVTPNDSLGFARQIIALDDLHLRSTVDARVTERYQEFTLSFVEFDDHGKFWNKTQQLTAVDKLCNEPGATTNGALMLVFVHGWFNNADVCNANVKMFRKMLLQLSEIEQQRSNIKHSTQPERPPRRIIGLYVGWRGLSQNGLAKYLTFWSRKNTAQKIGAGDMDELLVHLDVLKQQLAHSHTPTRLVIIGHSFGGALVDSAVDNILKERAVRDLLEAPHQPDGTTEAPLIRGVFGDLIVLVNPAFEALRYSGIAEATATMKMYHPNPLQTTVLMIVGAQNDQATGFAFPIGQQIPALMQNFKDPIERSMYTKAVGHYQDYFTELIDIRPTVRAQAEGKLAHTTVWKEEDISIHTQGALARSLTWHDFVPVEGRRSWRITSLPPGSHQPLNTPFMVISATPAVIDGHSGFDNLVFLDFLRDFIVAQDILKEHNETKTSEASSASQY